MNYGWTKSANAELDQLLDEGTHTIDKEKRKQIYAKVQQIIMKEAMIVPLWEAYQITGARAEAKDLRFDPRGWYPLLYDVYIQK